MPTLTFNNYPPVDGDTLDPSRVEGWIRDETDPDAVLSIVNGLLDSDNVVDALGVKAEHTQRGSWVTAASSSGTANLDYFSNYFKGRSSSAWDATDLGQGRAIPGACRRVWVPWTADVLVLAGLMFGNTSESENEKSWIYMTVDGSYIDDQRRDVRRSLLTLTNVTTAVDLHRGYRRSRHWAPAYIATSVTEGWHDFALNIACQEGIPMTRCWARHMVVIPFKQ